MGSVAGGAAGAGIDAGAGAGTPENGAGAVGAVIFLGARCGARSFPAAKRLESSLALSERSRIGVPDIGVGATGRAAGAAGFGRATGTPGGVAGEAAGAGDAGWTSGGFGVPGAAIGAIGLLGAAEMPIEDSGPA